VLSAQKKGIVAKGGLYMLVQQAIAAFELFFDQEPDQNKADAIYKNLLSKKQNSMIKPAILEQSVIAGVGNIYADEALWRAKIHPETRIKDFSNVDFKNLHESIRFVMNIIRTIPNTLLAAILVSIVGIGEDEYLVSDMIGFKVYDVKGDEYLGEITEIMDTAAHDIYVIENEEFETMIPDVDVFIKNIDFENRKMLVDTIEGMKEPKVKK